MRIPYVLFVLLMMAAGCGPLMGPMTVRMDLERQKTVDSMWENMLTPTQRLDHELLLEVLWQYSLYQMGVDRLHLTAEKRYRQGLALMEIDCDSANPDVDQFTVTLLDERGRTLRRERYDRKEMEALARQFEMVPEVKSENSSPQPPEERERLLQRRLQFERLHERIRAATQPAGIRSEKATPVR